MRDSAESIIHVYINNKLFQTAVICGTPALVCYSF